MPPLPLFPASLFSSLAGENPMPPSQPQFHPAEHLRRLPTSIMPTPPMPVETVLTICEVREEDIGLSDGDVLIFPEMIKYRWLHH
ncbi:hypothetical protein P3S67_020838 [Capsicum chacoense]